MFTKAKEETKALVNEAIIEMRSEIVAPSKKTKRIAIITFIIAMVMMMTVTAFGAGGGDELVGKVESLTKQLFGYILAVSSGLAILFIAINIGKMMLSSDKQATAEAKKAIIRIVICWVALNSMTAIARIIGDLAGGNNGMTTWQPN